MPCSIRSIRHDSCSSVFRPSLNIRLHHIHHTRAKMGESTPIPSHQAKTPLDLDYIDRAMTFIPSERCTISCGTACVDPKASKVLIIFNRRLGIWQLPKGRKDIGETLHSAALRETYEETGVRASLFPLLIQTRCTKPRTEDWAAHDATGSENPGSTMTHRTVPSIASVSSASTAYSTSTASSASSTTALEGITPADAVYDFKMTDRKSVV